MGGIGDTKKDLREAIEGEGYEFKEMYPALIQRAEAEGHKAALVSFRNANAVEKTHYDLYRQALVKDESGHGKGKGKRHYKHEWKEHGGETPDWARGKGYWDGHYKHDRSPQYYRDDHRAYYGGHQYRGDYGYES